MKKHIYDTTGRTLLRVEDATPECGQDFCDRCGDCLECYGYDDCYAGGENNGPHLWVVYEDTDHATP